MMVELKTLKDLEISSGGWLSEPKAGSLRDEAIKWVKMLKEKRKETTSRYEIGWNEGRTQWVMEFFDLTEEDLR